MLQKQQKVHNHYTMHCKTLHSWDTIQIHKIISAIPNLMNIFTIFQDLLTSAEEWEPLQLKYVLDMKII